MWYVNEEKLRTFNLRSRRTSVYARVPQGVIFTKRIPMFSKFKDFDGAASTKRANGVRLTRMDLFVRQNPHMYDRKLFEASVDGRISYSIRIEIYEKVLTRIRKKKLRNNRVRDK